MCCVYVCVVCVCVFVYVWDWFDARSGERPDDDDFGPKKRTASEIWVQDRVQPSPYVSRGRLQAIYRK